MAREIPEELRPLVEHVLQAVGTPIESFPVRYPSENEGWNHAARWLEKYYALENGMRELLIAMGVTRATVLEAAARAQRGVEQP